MDDIRVLPADIFRSLANYLPEEAMERLAITAKDLKRKIKKTRQRNEYWKSRVLEEIDWIPENADINWKEFYIELTKRHGEAFAVGRFFSETDIISWYEYRFETDKAGDVVFRVRMDANDIIKGIIQSDRIDVYDNMLEYLDNPKDNQIPLSGKKVVIDKEKLLHWILESDDGWNLLVLELPKLKSAMKDQSLALLVSSSSSADIAHFLLALELYSEPIDKRIKERIASKVITHAPQNLDFYLGQVIDIEEELQTELEKFQQTPWMYDFGVDSSDEVREFMILMVTCADDSTLKNMARSKMETFNLRSDLFLRILLKDARVTRPFVIENILIPLFISKGPLLYLPGFKLLNESLSYDVSTYIEAGIMNVADIRLAHYIDSQKSFPEKFQQAADILIMIIGSEVKPVETPSTSGVFTDFEARRVTNKLAEVCARVPGTIKIRGYVNRLLSGNQLTDDEEFDLSALMDARFQ